MGILNKLISKWDGTTSITTKPGKLYAPLTGTTIALEKLPDAVFSQGILGQGCGIEPESGEVVSPVDGIVSAIAETKHAIGITTAEGAELLIHVGMDTVDMNGRGFNVKVQVGQKVSCGQLLLAFDIEEIKKAGHPAVTAFVVTNVDDFKKVEMKIGIHVNKTEEIGTIQG